MRTREIYANTTFQGSGPQMVNSHVLFEIASNLHSDQVHFPNVTLQTQDHEDLGKNLGSYKVIS